MTAGTSARFSTNLPGRSSPRCSSLRPDRHRDHARRVVVQTAAVIVAVQRVKFEPVPLEQQLQLARNDPRQIKIHLRALLVAVSVEPTVVERDVLNLPCGFRANVDVAVNRSQECMNVKHAW